LTRPAAAWVGLVAAAWCGPASAQTKASIGPITVEAIVPLCEPGPYDRADFLELLRVELAALGVTNLVVHAASAEMAGESTARSETTLATVIVTPTACTPDADTVVLEIVDHTSKKSVERRMTLGDVGTDARPRALALAVVELLGASWAELFLPRSRAPDQQELPESVRNAIAVRLRATPPPQVAPPQPAPAEPQIEPIAAAPPESEPHRARLGARASFWSMPSRGTSLLGGGLGASYDSSQTVRFHLGGDVNVGDARVTQGDVNVGWAEATIGFDLVARSDVELAIGPRLRAGYGWATGDPARADVTGSTRSGAVVALLAGGTVRVPMTSRVFATLGLELGHVLKGLTFLADTERAAGLDAALFGLATGLDVEL
jgi:hypothetical protein